MVKTIAANPTIKWELPSPSLLWWVAEWMDPQWLAPKDPRAKNTKRQSTLSNYKLQLVSTGANKRAEQKIAKCVPIVTALAERLLAGEEMYAAAEAVGEKFKCPIARLENIFISSWKACPKA